MKTKHKILFAKIIFLIISNFIKKNIKVVRNNISWNLDLSQGIDLSIYIFGKFEFEIVKKNTNKTNDVIEFTNLKLM